MKQSSPIELRGEPSGSTSKSDDKPIPTKFICAPNLQFTYSGSPDGVDTNLLVLLHGRGDSEVPFAKLADSLRLPQTATLALRGPLTVPLLDEHEREWWNETDMMGMNIPNPDPTTAINTLSDILAELQQDPYGWPADHMHLFGFGQGGTLAVETAIKFGKRAKSGGQVASIVTIQGPLLSLPSHGAPLLSTKILYVYRAKSSTVPSLAKAAIAALQRAFTSVRTLRLKEKSGGAVAMPDSKAEWEGIMSFWSEHLQSTSAWQRQGEVYELSSGQGAGDLPYASSARTGASQAESSKPESIQAHQSPDAATVTTSVTEPAKPTIKSPSGFKRGFLSRGL